MRALFATSFIHGEITDAGAIWDKFATNFCDDLPHQLQNWLNIPEHLTNPHHDYGLYLLNELLKESGKNLEQCGLPLPTHIWRAENSLLRRELDYDPWEEVLLEAEKKATLNLDQKQCFQKITSAVDSTIEETRPYFLSKALLAQEKHSCTVFCAIIIAHMRRLYFVLLLLVLHHYYYQEVVHPILGFEILLIHMSVHNAILAKTRN